MTPPSVGKTQGDLVSSIYDWLKVDSRRLSAAAATDVINMARKDISRKYKLNYAESTYQFNTQIGLATYALPDDFSQPVTFRYLDSDSDEWIFLRYRAYADFLSKNITSDEEDEWVDDEEIPGAPEEYTWWQRNLILRPTPTVVVPMYFDYFALSAEMKTSAAYDSLTMYAWDVLLFKCLEFACRYLLEDQRALMWKGQADETQMDLHREYSRSRSAARIPQAKEYGSFPGTGRHHEYWWYFF